MSVLFVDEVKAKSYLMVAVVVEPANLARFRKTLKSHVQPGQRSFHFSGERDSRRKEFLTTCKNLGFSAYYVDGGSGHDFDTRPTALRKVVDLAVVLNARQIIFDLDESVLKRDEIFLRQVIKEKHLEAILGFEHFKRHEDPLLWVPDAIAWSINRGGDWVLLVESMLKN